MRTVIRDAGACTDVGRLRQSNEDALLLSEPVFAVADGMGGHLGGEVASATAIEVLRASVAGGRAIDEAIVLANDAVLARAGADSALAGMGTTLTGLVVGKIGRAHV